MNKAVDTKNPYEIPRVVLSSIADEIQLDENLEPPFVRVRNTNSQFMQINNSDNPGNQNPYEVIIPLNRSMPRVNRIQIRYVIFKLYTPNINPRNNIFNFRVLGVLYTATIASDVHLVGAARYTALVNAMNTATGNPGEFTVAPGAVYPDSFVITNTLARTFRFDNSSTGIKFGRYLWGFNENNYLPGTEATSQSLTFYTNNYSRYIDITSFELTQYTKIDTSGTDIAAETLYRLFINEMAYGGVKTDTVISSASLNYDRSRAISSVDINLNDEFGQTFYVPPAVWGSAEFSLGFLASM